MTTRLFAAILIVVLTVAAAPGQTPLSNAFTYQGRLENAGGPVNGLHDLQFVLYGVPEGAGRVGGPICADNVSVSGGSFVVPLDFGAVYDGNERWLEVGVRADSTAGNCGTGAYTPLWPRQPLTAAPYAFFAPNAGQLDGLEASAFLQSVPVPLTLSAPSDTHILLAQNTTNSSGASAIRGEATGGLSSGNVGVFGQSAGVFGTGVYGVSTSTGTAGGFGVQGHTASPSGRGVLGNATATTGLAYGGRFQSASTEGVGVYGEASAGSGLTYGVYGWNFSTGGRGVFGLTYAETGVTSGVYGETRSASGRGVFGHATAASGFTYGGRFESDSTNGRGVYGLATAATGTTFGGRFASLSSGGRGVYGAASAASGTTYGGYFESTSENGTGVYGSATDSDGETYGGYFESSSSDGTGVYGQGDVGVRAVGDAGVIAEGNFTGVSGVGSNYGGKFASDGTDGRAVHGEVTATSGITYGARFENYSTDGVGVFVWCRAFTGDHYAVYGDTDSHDGYAIYAAGNLAASGTKSFRIDHPDDPANKYLRHYCAESPEIINFYRGTVVLDGAGQAVVELPHYFAKINKTPSYQLTAVGAPMPMLHVAAKISDAALDAGAKAEPGEAAPLCSFRIAGGAPGGEVSWEVKAARNDRWVQQRGAPVEIDKRGREKGTYQHPELYGQPPEKGMSFTAESARPLPVAPPEATRN